MYDLFFEWVFIGYNLGVVFLPTMQSWQIKVYFGIPGRLKMECHPGGDWNPGWGVDLRNNYHLFFRVFVTARGPP